MKHFLIFLLFITSSIWATNNMDIEPFVEPSEEIHKVENIQNKPVQITTSTEIDSVNIYTDLIAQEREQSNYVPNIVGITISSLIIGGGTYFLVLGIQAANTERKNDTDFGVIFTIIAGGVLIGTSIPFYLVGIPVLAYNTYALIKHKKHHNKMIKYQKQYDDYKARISKQNSELAVEWMVLPTLNIANASGGLNLFLAF